MLTRGTPVIINTTDRPEAKLVAVLRRYDDRAGKWFALYLSPLTNMRECWTTGTCIALIPCDAGRRDHCHA